MKGALFLSGDDEAGSSSLPRPTSFFKLDKDIKKKRKQGMKER